MASVSAAASSGGAARNLLQFLRLVGQLKRVPRTGWVYRNVEKPESVSDHMYRMAVMALVTKDDQLNKDRCVRLALVHDVAECIVGDIAPADNVPKEEKHRREKEAMKQLTQLLPKDLSKELYELWEPLLPFFCLQLLVKESGLFGLWCFPRSGFLLIARSWRSLRVPVLLFSTCWQLDPQAGSYSGWIPLTRL
ncbi:5'-deoxynucleotidase HDDC2 isoform X1 [Loxodonta africana]|uniref:5'-deoxynucleotidase HDDC2 isoform X1 n=1 Tax=Loxodonta africana TaxID=9785 RepID=UPI000C8146DB|nr:HD domain-containing protein 2 isoform X1 [Loxodonta africana]